MELISKIFLSHGRRSRGDWRGCGGCSPPPSFCQIFAKSPFFVSNFSISMPSAPSRSSQPPHFQIHAAVNVNLGSKRSHLKEKLSVLGSRIFGSQFYISSRIFGCIFSGQMAHPVCYGLRLPPLVYFYHDPLRT